MGISVVKTPPPFAAVAFEIPGNWEIASAPVRFFDNSIRFVPKVYSGGEVVMLPALIREAYLRGPISPLELVKDMATVVETEHSYFVAEWKQLEEGGR